MTRQEMESRRIEAFPLLFTVTEHALAKRLNVSRQTVYRWRQAVRAGQGLARRTATGRPRRITVAQENAIRRLYDTGPATGPPKWTQRKFARVMFLELGINYSRDHTGRIMHRLGLTTKRPRRTPTV